MLFNSYIFIFLFLPLALAGYFLLNRLGRNKLAQAFLIGMSLWFYAYFNLSYLPIICLSILGNYLISRLLNRQGLEQKWRKLLLALGILANVAAIGYYKYFDFFLSNLNALFHADFSLRHIVLPLGISFFTFQQISYLVDSYRGETGDYGFLEYALFVSFFPQLVAGPIVLHSEMIPQFRDRELRRFDWESFAQGLFLFSVGLGKKVLLADVLGQAVDYGYAGLDRLYAISSLDVILVSLCYTFQIYFDFSGYCDMATGICRMFHMRLPQNFNSPYRAVSISDYWRRWHMSLGRFLRTYIYFPLGGSRKGTVRTYLNTMAIFLVSGIWHGANWTFILWGALHGLLSCLTRAVDRWWSRWNDWVRRILTFLTINGLFVLFRADSVMTAIRTLVRMMRLESFTLDRQILAFFDTAELQFLEYLFPALSRLPAQIPGLHLFMFLIGSFLIVMFGKNTWQMAEKLSAGRGLSTLALLSSSILALSGVHIFLYFNF